MFGTMRVFYRQQEQRRHQQRLLQQQQLKQQPSKTQLTELPTNHEYSQISQLNPLLQLSQLSPNNNIAQRFSQSQYDGGLLTSQLSPQRDVNDANENMMGLISPVIPAPPAAAVKGARGRPKMTDKFIWTDASTELLIDMWRDKDILFDVKHPEYYKREKKGNAIKEIRKALGCNGYHVDVIDINSKFTSLKSYFSQERAKVTASQSGDGTDNVYESRWKFYTRLTFLNDSMTPRGVYSNLGNDGDGTNVKRKNSKTSTSSVENVERLMATAVHHLQTPDTSEDAIFGILIAKKLKKLPDGLRKEEAKLKILMDLNKVSYPSS